MIIKPLDAYYYYYYYLFILIFSVRFPPPPHCTDTCIEKHYTPKYLSKLNISLILNEPNPDPKTP